MIPAGWWINLISQFQLVWVDFGLTLGSLGITQTHDEDLLYSCSNILHFGDMLDSIYYSCSFFTKYVSVGSQWDQINVCKYFYLETLVWTEIWNYTCKLYNISCWIWVTLGWVCVSLQMAIWAILVATLAKNPTFSHDIEIVHLLAHDRLIGLPMHRPMVFSQKTSILREKKAGKNFVW